MDSTANDKGSETAIHEAESASSGLANVVEELARTVGTRAHAETVFGTPITHEGVTVIRYVFGHLRSTLNWSGHWRRGGS
jgi:hypothetical protein